jgi:hypothetical protein
VACFETGGRGRQAARWRRKTALPMPPTGPSPPAPRRWWWGGWARTPSAQPAAALLVLGRAGAGAVRFTIVQVNPQQATKAIRVLSTRKIVTRRQKLGCHFLLRRQVFAVVCCGAVSSRDSFYMINEMVPSRGADAGEPLLGAAGGPGRGIASPPPVGFLGGGGGCFLGGFFFFF